LYREFSGLTAEHNQRQVLNKTAHLIKPCYVTPVTRGGSFFHLGHSLNQIATQQRRAQQKIYACFRLAIRDQQNDFSLCFGFARKSCGNHPQKAAGNGCLTSAFDSCGIELAPGSWTKFQAPVQGGITA
jgi:hypothetical protein